MIIQRTQMRVVLVVIIDVLTVKGTAPASPVTKDWVLPTF